MSIMAIESAERIITSHGFACVRLNDGVSIAIPWNRPGASEEGVEWIECRTYRQVFIALGY